MACAAAVCCCTSSYEIRCTAGNMPLTRGGANGTRTRNPLLANILSPRISLGIARLAGATAGAEERGTRPALGSDWGRTTAPCDRCLFRDARPSGRRRADGCGRPGLSVVVDLLAGAVLLSLVRRRLVVADCRPTHYESQAGHVDQSSPVYGCSLASADGRARTLTLLDLWLLCLGSPCPRLKGQRTSTALQRRRQRPA